MSSKTPHGTANTAGRFAYQGLVLTGLKLFVKPLVNAVSNYIGCDGQNEGKECLHRFFTPFPNLMESEGRHLQDTIKFDETQEKAAVQLQNCTAAFYI